MNPSAVAKIVPNNLCKNLLAWGETSMFVRNLQLIRSIRRAYTATSSARLSLPDLLPFLEKHASTEAELHLRDVLRNKSNDDNAWKRKAKKAYTEASYYEYALGLEEDEYERGRLFMLSNQPNAAKQCYDRAHQASPDHPRILISLAAWEYRQQQDYDAALQYLHQAMEKADEKDADIRLEIRKYQGLMHRSKGDFKQALSTYLTAIEAGATDCLVDVADMHAALEDWISARDLYQRILNDATDDAARAALLHNLGRCYAQNELYHKDQGEAAISYCLKSLELKRKQKADNSEVAKTVNLLGVLYARRNDKPKALLRFTESLTLLRSGQCDHENPLVLHAMRNIAVLKGQKVPEWN